MQIKGYQKVFMMWNFHNVNVKDMTDELISSHTDAFINHINKQI